MPVLSLLEAPIFQLFSSCICPQGNMTVAPISMIFFGMEHAADCQPLTGEIYCE